VSDGCGDDDPIDLTCPACLAEVQATWATKHAACECGNVWVPTAADMLPAFVHEMFGGRP